MLNLDDKLTLYLNSFHTPYWDDFFFVFSGQLFWLPLAAVIIYVIVREYGKQSFIPLLFIALVVLCADQISSSIFKPLFERLRPSHDPDLIGLIHNVRGYKGGKYGFVSSHAANAFGFAVFSALLLKNKIFSYVVIFWSVITTYSRLYLGVHFFGDIFCGAILGAILGALLYYILVYIDTKSNFTIKPIRNTSAIYVLSVFLISIFILLSFAKHLIFMA